MIHDRQCIYGPAIAGVDVSIDGDVWPGSPLDLHLESRQHAEVCIPRQRARREAEEWVRDIVCVDTHRQGRVLIVRVKLRHGIWIRAGLDVERYAADHGLERVLEHLGPIARRSR